MNYEEFAEEIRWGVENMVRDRFGDGVAVIRSVTKNNNVRMKAISIMRKEEKATPTIYIRDYYDHYKKGRTIENICEEIFHIYKCGIEKFKYNFDPNDFMQLEKIKGRVFYKLINYEMNKKMLKDMPYFKYLDLAIVFYIMISCDESGQASAMVHNIHLDSWKISPEELKEIALKNTWNTYPAVIKPMEDIVSEMIMGEIMEDDDSEDYEGGDVIREDFQYGEFDYDEVKNIIREEIEKLKADSEMKMYVLTNQIRTNGAACITYPGVLREFAEEHDSDVYIIPSSIHEVILIEGTEWEKSKLNQMVMEVNAKELDPVEVLADHIYVFKREDNEIHY